MSKAERNKGMKVIGAGWGRTGTASLKAALEVCFVIGVRSSSHIVKGTWIWTLLSYARTHKAQGF